MKMALKSLPFAGLNSIAMAAPQEMPAFGNGGIQSGGNDQQLPSGESEELDDGDYSHVPIFGSEDDKDPAGLDDVFSMFSGETTGEVDDTTPVQLESLTDVAPEEINQLQQRMQQMISGMRIDEATIPEDFDPADRGQLLAVLSQVQQQTIQQALGVVFAPVQLAINTMASRIDGRIKQQITESGVRNTAQQTVRQMVPEWDDERYGGVVQTLDRSLREAGKKPVERARAIRKMLDQMGVRAQNNRPSVGATRQNTQSNGSTHKTGAAALDSFFGGLGPKKKK